MARIHIFGASGSLYGWGDIFIPYFDLAVFLWIPIELRLERLKNREKSRYGDLILPGGSMEEKFLHTLRILVKVISSSEEIKNEVQNDY